MCFSLEKVDSFTCIAGTTALIKAVHNRHQQCVNLWIETGTHVNATDVNHTTVLAVAIRKKDLTGPDVNSPIHGGMTALWQAQYNSFAACLDSLMKTGADVNHVDQFFMTVLMHASERGSIQCLDILLKAGADVNHSANNGDTALILAWRGCHIESMELLIKAGADVNHSAKNGDTALILACRGCHIESMELLIKAGADVNITNTNGCTAIFPAHPGIDTMQYKRCVRALLRADILINRVNHLGRNALAEVLRFRFDNFTSSKLLFAAGDSLENVEENKIPDCLKFHDLQLHLKHICRETIRKHLLELDPHHHLFDRIPRHGLPSALMNYLLCGQSLDDDVLGDVVAKLHHRRRQLVVNVSALRRRKKYLIEKRY